nr:MAG TPA: hypothetical protein [Caudoviricetes sp.]
MDINHSTALNGLVCFHFYCNIINIVYFFLYFISYCKYTYFINYFSNYCNNLRCFKISLSILTF